jgi:hypothetical protein
MTLAAQLTFALQDAGIPIISVSIGTPGDRSTWRIEYAPTVTEQQRIDGDNLRVTFDPTSPEAIERAKNRLVNAELARALIKATLIYHERERYLDQNGRYPTLAELDPILDAQRPKFIAILKTQL